MEDLLIILDEVKNRKKIADVQFQRCDKCNNMVMYELWQSRKKSGLQAMLTSSRNSKYYMVCSACHLGIEITNSDKAKYLALSKSCPRREDLMTAWDFVLSNWHFITKDKIIDDVTIIPEFIKLQIIELEKNNYTNDVANYTLQLFLRELNKEVTKHFAVCKECNTQNTENAKYCNNCGANLEVLPIEMK
ncbi:MAG: zinc ribbon domain-containing protein [Dehalococcoidia bacterium]